MSDGGAAATDSERKISGASSSNGATSPDCVSLSVNNSNVRPENGADTAARVKRHSFGFRHEHEYNVWRDVKLPAGKILIPGVVSHSTDLVEHFELVVHFLQ